MCSPLAAHFSVIVERDKLLDVWRVIMEKQLNGETVVTYLQYEQAFRDEFKRGLIVLLSLP